MPIIGFKGVMGDHSIKVQKEIFNKCIFCLFKLPKYILELIIIITIIIIIIIIILLFFHRERPWKVTKRKPKIHAHVCCNPCPLHCCILNNNQLATNLRGNV